MLNKHKILGLLVGLLVLRLLLMAFVPVFDTSESRYAAISANMARTGDFVVPHFTYEGHYQSFDGKPPLVFQAGGLACKILGTENPIALQFAVRVCPFLSAILLLLILFHGVKKFADAETAYLAVLVCATSTAFLAAAGICMTDMTLTLAVAGSLILYRCFAEERELRYAFGVAALLGVGMITKGPVALVLFGLPVFVDACVNKRWRSVFAWQWLVAAPVFFLVAVPWFVLVEQRNPGSVLYFFYNENFLRFVKHDYGDKYGAGREAFRGVAILWALVATLPWALVPVGTLFSAVRHHRLGDAVSHRNDGDAVSHRNDGDAVSHRNDGDAVSHRVAETDGSSLSDAERLRVSRWWRSFSLLAILSIVGFWCLTSRVLIYYLFPVIPLFAAALALKGDRKLLAHLVPWVAGFSALVLTAGFVSGALCSRKMQGAKAPNTYGYDGYAHEFYHGTSPRCLTEKGVTLDDSFKDQWMKSPQGRQWIATPQGQKWMELPGNRQWMKEWGYAK